MGNGRVVVAKAAGIGRWLIGVRRITSTIHSVQGDAARLVDGRLSTHAFFAVR